MERAYRVKSKFSVSPEKMARIYTILATEDGYPDFLYNEKEEVVVNRSAYNKEMQGR